MSILEPILHSKKLSYETLIPLIKPYVDARRVDVNRSRTVNVFVDFNDVIKQLYNPDIISKLNTLRVDERYMISSEIINIIAHYRHFFYSRMQMYTNIIFYYSSEQDTYKTHINPNFKKSFYEKRLDLNHKTFNILNRILHNNINLIKLFCEYVPHAYFINTGNIDSNVLPYLFLSKNSKLKQAITRDADTSIIVSNDKFHYQDLLLNDNVMQLELRGKEKSKFVTAEDIIPNLLSKSKKEYNFSILPDLYPLILSLSGHKDYEVSGIKRMGNIKAMQFIQKCIDENILKNISYNNIELLSVLDGKLKPEELKQLTENLLVLNNDLYDFNRDDLIKIEMQLVDRIDAKSVRFVNDKYFTKYPILLEYCFEGEQYE